jgi:hypothetical protein
MSGFGANTEYVLEDDAGHNYGDDIIAKAITHIYGNLQNSGVDVNDDLKSPDADWKELRGTFSKFK